MRRDPQADVSSAEWSSGYTMHVSRTSAERERERDEDYGRTTVTVQDNVQHLAVLNRNSLDRLLTIQFSSPPPPVKGGERARGARLEREIRGLTSMVWDEKCAP